MDASSMKFELAGLGAQLKHKSLEVPFYQRSYAWQREQVSEFWTDLRTAFSEGEPYFLGTLVLTHKDESSSHTIIDGQQRLATTAILYAAIRNVFRARGDEDAAKTIGEHYLTTNTVLQGEKSRLSLNSEDNDFFNRRIIQGNASADPVKNSHKLILDAYEFLHQNVIKVADDAGVEWRKRLGEWAENFLEERLSGMILEVPDESDAFLIFETLNDRGADLTIADLLKNYLFGHAGPKKLNAVRDGWMQILGALDISGENSLFTTFLRHYWSSKYGVVRERGLYRSIKDSVATDIQVLDFITELQDAAQLYAALLNSDHTYWRSYGSTAKANIQILLRLDLEQNRPLLLAALKNFTKPENKRLLRSLISWSVRGLIVGGIGGGVTEAAYCGAAVKIWRHEIKTTSDVLAEITAIVPTDDQFQAAFSEARVPRKFLARYYLLALERGRLGDAQPEEVLNSNEEEVDLEHVLPQRASDEDWGSDFTAEERRDWTQRLGNQALLQTAKNSQLGNKPFATKRPVLKKSSIALTSEIGDTRVWTKEAIAARQVNLASLAVSVWPR